MEALDLKKFAWNKNHVNYCILAITTYKGDDVVVFRNHDDSKHEIAILSVDDFCREFQATYAI